MPNIQSATKDNTRKISAALDTFKKAYPTEKLFIHTDKPYYSLGDTLWFKSYLFDAKTLFSSRKSGLLYAELISDSGQVVQRICVPVNHGLSWAQITLDANVFAEGAYTLRAYTNWMQNFGEDNFFKKTVYITATNEKAWLVKQQHRLMYKNGLPMLNLALQLTNTTNESVAVKDLRLKLMDGSKILSNGLFSSADGRIETNINLPERLKGPLTLRLEESGNEDNKSIIPIALKEAEEPDLQFMPESGYLISGIPSRVGFKAVGVDGLGRDIEGKIFDSKHSEVASFKSIRHGMGVVEIAPQAGEAYSAEVRLQNGLTKTYPLPAVKASGTALRIDNNPASDSLRVNILLTSDLLNGGAFQLMGFTNETCYYSASFTGDRQRIVGKIPKNKFPTGVVHFTLFNSRNEPLNDRIVFINHNDGIVISVKSNKQVHAIRDSIRLRIEAKDALGKPVKASFSLSVTDDSVIKPDLFQENILSRVFLTSDLKGMVEAPAFYFSKSEKAGAALDALMLTQGWTGYDWDKIFKPIDKPRFKPETELKISGRVLNAFNKPLSNASLSLMSLGKYRFYRNAVTDKYGRFEFKKFPQMDTVGFFVQAKNLNNKSFNVDVDFDRFVPASAPILKGPRIKSWNVNSDTTLIRYVKNKQQDKIQERELTNKGKNILDEVVITAKRTIKNSKNLNGPGGADQIIVEKQMIKDRKTTLLDLIEKHVEGFHSQTVTPKVRTAAVFGPRPPTVPIAWLGRSSVDEADRSQQFYFIKDKRVSFIMDGVRLDQFFERTDLEDRDEHFNFLTELLNSVPADDITGLEVMRQSRYTNSYNSEHAPFTTKVNQIAYIEITTRAGIGPAARIKPGTAVIKPIPLTWPKQFYKPRYTAANLNSPVFDYRSAIHWDTNVYCDETGKGFTSFYAADRPGTYTVIVQGSNMAGLVGYQSIRLNIEGRKK